ncbi:hypothetical protein TRFO_05224 [Tritrichomonas foetus]|uniref:AMMECR1 domain-containing protein n=1 Tax=Tritrichomonas foetus TaxID=1144522 RepID=A0A1J4KCZ4_9EUKA|nr:hypothetical protein TRFO_05224 [Tritrichomonas foetus]|eukprot:OHT07572.1 hypothetical protein TRFO_05224 [Tritrichomonas foetus]
MTSDSQPATKELCYLCFEALENEVLNQKSTKVSSRVVQQSNVAFPMFVTWKIGDALRGCIGNFKPLPLYSGLQEYALISALKDFRFDPVTAREIPKLNVGISLLHTFEDAQNALDWEVGKHGIRLFIDGMSATFLPEVASEQGWTKEETLQHLARKAGMYKPFDSAALARAKVERYQSSKCKVTYDEYKQYLASLS